MSIKLEHVHLTAFEVVGPGQMRAQLEYTQSTPKWGVLPIRTPKKDTLTYYIQINSAGTITLRSDSLALKELGKDIPESLRKSIIALLQEYGQIHSII